MAEIRANREYKFKEFCISEEIPKSPPIKTKRWTFHDTNPNIDRFYNRPVQRRWDEKDSCHVNSSGDTNIYQQYVKPFKKPESDLRAEFFNAYKKYYRRVDIKRLEVQSTLNVDAKFKGTDESVEGESSLYKEKECMEINIVMDTEKDDALVSSKVRRTVLCVSPEEEGPPGKESARPAKMINGVPEELTTSGQNIGLDQISVDETPYCSSPYRPSCLITDLSVAPEQTFFSQENQPNRTPRLKQEQPSIKRAFVPFVEMSQSSNNIDSKSENNLLQRSDKASIFNHERFAPDSGKDNVQKTDLLAKDQPSSACLPLTTMAGRNNSTATDVDELIQKDEKNVCAKRVERTFYNSKMKPKTKDPVYPTTFNLQNPVEKSSTSEIFHNKKTNFKRSISSAYIDCEDVARTSEDDFAPLTFDNSRPNTSNHGFEISPKAEKIFNIAPHSKNLDVYGPKSDSDDILTARDTLRRYHRNKLNSNDDHFQERATGSIMGQAENSNITVSIFRTESGHDPSGTKSLEETENNTILTSEDEFSSSESGVRFRGLRGALFNESNKTLKSVVVNIIQSDSNCGRSVIKREFNSFPQKDPTNLIQRHENKEVPNLERRDAYTCSRKSFITDTNTDFRKSSQISSCDPVNSNYTKLEVAETFQNVTKRSERSNDSKNPCLEEKLFTSARRENTEKPFVIWTNKNSTDLTESLKINKLMASDNGSKIGSDYETNSNLQSFSDWYSVREIPDSSKNQPKVNKQDHQNHSQSSEKRKEKTNLREVSKTSNETEGKENGLLERQFPARRYSNMTSVPSKNCALSKYRSYDASSRVLDSNYKKEDEKSEICRERAISFDENGGWMDERSGVVSQRHYTEESLDKRESKERSRQNMIPNGCVVGERQLIERVTRTHGKNTTMDEPNRIRNGREEDVGKKKISKQVLNENNVIEQPNINLYESNGCDKKISKSSNSDFLQIGPTYSVHYTPAHKKGLRRDLQKNYDETWGGKEMDDRCNGGPAKAFHCSHESAKDFICRKWNETLPRKSCNHSDSFYCDDYLTTCRHEIICNAYYEPNSNINSCEYHKAGYNKYPHCENLNRGFPQRMSKNNNVCPCHVGVPTNLDCHSRSSCNCLQRMNNHRRPISCPCQEGNRNYCQECGDEQMRFPFKECSANFQKPNNQLCSCPHCSPEMRIDAVSTRKGNYCGGCSGDELVNCCPLRFDRERQWMSTGHQPTRNANKSTVDAHIERSEESSTRGIVLNNDFKEPFMRDFKNHCPVNSLHNDNRHYTEEYSIADNQRINNSYNYDNEVKNVCQFEPTGKNSVRNHSLRDIKTERKYYDNPGDSGVVNLNFPGWVNNSAIEEELKGPGEKLIPEKKVLGVEERKIYSSEGKTFCITEPFNSYDRNTKDTEVPLQVSDRLTNEPLFLCEEQWDSDDGLPMRRVVRKKEEKEEEKRDSSASEDEPIYLREEHWESDDEETGANKVFSRDFRPTSVRYPNDIKCLWKGQRPADSHPAGRSGNYSEGEESRKCSSVHAVSDPSFHCEEQWASDEEKCEDHKFQSTLPKNRTKKRRWRGKRSFNPRRWDMVTDLPKNEYIARQNNNNRQNNYGEVNFGDSVVFQNRKYYSNNEQ